MPFDIEGIKLKIGVLFSLLAFATSAKAINEHENSSNIAESAVELAQLAKREIDETCSPRLNIDLQRLHGLFIYSNLEYILPNDHFFWGEVKRDIGLEYWAWGCESIARSLFEEAQEHALLSANEILINEVQDLPDSLLSPGQFNDELCRRVERPDCLRAQE